MAQLVKDPPAILYKYRGNVGRDLKCLLVERCLYLASPLALNDPFDCFPAITTPDVVDYEEFISSQIAKAPPGIGEKEVRRRCRLLLTSEAHRKRYSEEFYREDLGKLGVLSLSAPRDEPLLWSHYASNAAGFAVGYRARTDGTLEALGAAPVRYTMQRPAMDPFDDKEDWFRILFTKSKHWSYEQEWRYVRMTQDGGVGVMTVPHNSIVEVCLGPKMTASDRDAVIKAARALADQPRIVQVQLDSACYGLKFCDLD